MTSLVDAIGKLDLSKGAARHNGPFMVASSLQADSTKRASVSFGEHQMANSIWRFEGRQPSDKVWSIFALEATLP